MKINEKLLQQTRAKSINNENINKNTGNIDEHPAQTQ